MNRRLHMLFLTLSLCFACGYAENEDTLRYELARVGKERQSLDVQHLGYTVCWNADWNIPNWVGYELTADEVNFALVERSNSFRADPDVPNSPTTADYKNSGYDRGHMAPSADMRWNEQAMRECFYMTNMCPQTHDLNGFDWAYLEEKVREWACRFGSVYVCCGPVLEKDSKECEYIGSKHKVLVPQMFFKVLLVQANGEWQAIGFVMRQDDTNHIKTDLSQFACAVDEVERLTGIDFFYALPDSVENRVEARYVFDFWR